MVDVSTHRQGVPLGAWECVLRASEPLLVGEAEGEKGVRERRAVNFSKQTQRDDPGNLGKQA